MFDKDLWEIALNDKGLSRLAATALLKLRKGKNTTLTENCTLHICEKLGAKEVQDRFRL